MPPLRGSVKARAEHAQSNILEIIEKSRCEAHKAWYTHHMNKKKDNTPKPQTPPASSLPLVWGWFNGCRECLAAAMNHNRKLCPFENAQAAHTWLYSLNHDDRDAWFRAIGWPEGDRYCRDWSYFVTTAWPNWNREVTCDCIPSELAEAANRAFENRKPLTLPALIKAGTSLKGYGKDVRSLVREEQGKHESH